MIIYYHCNSDNALLLSFLLTCHPYIPFHFMKLFLYLNISVPDVRLGGLALLTQISMVHIPSTVSSKFILHRPIGHGIHKFYTHILI